MTYPVNTILRLLKDPTASERRLGLMLIVKDRSYDLSNVVVHMMLSDYESEVRSMAAWTLDILGIPDHIPALIQAMYDASFDVRSSAGWALVNMARRLTPQLVLPEVIEVLQDEDHECAREMAYLVLTRIGGQTATWAINEFWK